MNERGIVLSIHVSLLPWKGSQPCLLGGGQWLARPFSVSHCQRSKHVSFVQHIRKHTPMHRTVLHGMHVHSHSYRRVGWHHSFAMLEMGSSARVSKWERGNEGNERVAALADSTKPLVCLHKHLSFHDAHCGCGCGCS